MIWFQTDTRAPLVLHAFSVSTPIVSQGGAIEYRALYDKRAECAPPLGSGEVRHKYELVEPRRRGGDGAVIRENVSAIKRAAWPSGVGLIGTGSALVPIDLPVGRYAFTATAVYACVGSPHLLQTVSPPMLVDIIAHQ